MYSNFLADVNSSNEASVKFHWNYACTKTAPLNATAVTSKHVFQLMKNLLT